jgi:hypothetical protein
MNRRDWRTVSLDSIAFDPGELEGQLLPTLRRDALSGGLSPATWAARLVSETRDALKILLPFIPPETDFLNRLLDHGEIVPELITDDKELAGRIRRHPMLHWKTVNVRQHRSR